MIIFLMILIFVAIICIIKGEKLTRIIASIILTISIAITILFVVRVYENRKASEEYEQRIEYYRRQNIMIK